MVFPFVHHDAPAHGFDMFWLSAIIPMISLMNTLTMKTIMPMIMFPATRGAFCALHVLSMLM